MLLSFFEDIDEKGNPTLGMAVGLLDEEYSRSDRSYVRIVQPNQLNDPFANAANNIIVWHTKRLC